MAKKNLSRDRKFVSKQKHELAYDKKAKSGRKGYKVSSKMAKGGEVTNAEKEFYDSKESMGFNKLDKEWRINGIKPNGYDEAKSKAQKLAKKLNVKIHYAKGGEVDNDKISQKALKDGYVFIYSSPLEDYDSFVEARVAYDDTRRSDEFSIYFNGVYVHISKTYSSMINKLKKLEDEYNLSLQVVRHKDSDDIYDDYFEKGGSVSKFKVGELVYDTEHKDYGTILNVFDVNEVKLDSNGNRPTDKLRKLGSKEDKGTKKELFKAVSSIESLQREYPENNYPTIINNPFYAKGGLMETYDSFDGDYDSFTNYVVDRIDLDERRRIRKQWNDSKSKMQWQDYLLREVNKKSMAKGGEVEDDDFIRLARLGVIMSNDEYGNDDVQRIDDVEDFTEDHELDFTPPQLINDDHAKLIKYLDDYSVYTQGNPFSNGKEFSVEVISNDGSDSFEIYGESEEEVRADILKFLPDELAIEVTEEYAKGGEIREMYGDFYGEEPEEDMSVDRMRIALIEDYDNQLGKLEASIDAESDENFREEYRKEIKEINKILKKLNSYSYAKGGSTSMEGYADSKFGELEREWGDTGIKPEGYDKAKDDFMSKSKGGEIEYSNDENESVGNFLLNHKDGKAILSKSKNGSDLETNVMEYHSSKGIPNWDFDDDEDGGIEWVTFSDLWDEVQGHYAKGGEVKLDSVKETKSHFGYSDEEWDDLTKGEQDDLREESMEHLTLGRQYKKEKSTFNLINGGWGLNLKWW